MTYFLVSVLKEQHESEMGQLESLVVTSQVNTVFLFINNNNNNNNNRSCWVNRASGSCGSWTSSWWPTSPSGTSSMRMINSLRPSMKWDQDWTKTLVVPQTKVVKEERKAPWSRTTFPLCTVTEWDQDMAITAPQEKRNEDRNMNAWSFLLWSDIRGADTIICNVSRRQWILLIAWVTQTTGLWPHSQDADLQSSDWLAFLWYSKHWLWHPGYDWTLK